MPGVTPGPPSWQIVEKARQAVEQRNNEPVTQVQLASLENRRFRRCRQAADGWTCAAG
jgi:hypothetical protein